MDWRETDVSLAKALNILQTSGVINANAHASGRNCSRTQAENYIKCKDRQTKGGYDVMNDNEMLYLNDDIETMRRAKKGQDTNSSATHVIHTRPEPKPQIMKSEINTRNQATYFNNST